MRVFLSNLGCKLNQAETDTIARELRARGHRIVSSLEQADLHLVNSCTVTHRADRDSRKTARRGARLGGPSRPRTVLTGCYATAAGEEARRLDGVDLVVGNGDKERLVDIVLTRFPELAPRTRAEVPVSYVPLELGPTRALIKVEDGCDMACSFCIIPSTRGRQRSRRLQDVVAEAVRLEAGGHREIVVTGVQISSYRDGESRLAHLVEALLGATVECRFRLTSIAPWQFAPGVEELLAHPRVCRHVHLSLQSGSETVLRRMRRPYTPRLFASLVSRLRRRVPGLAVTTDVIVGFPGESEREFREGLEFVRGLGLARIHAFPFSRRPGTEAAKLRDQIDPGCKKTRMRRMLDVARRSEEAHRRSHLGSTADVLWEEESSGRWRGMSDNYLRVYTRSDEPLRGRITSTTLVGLDAGGVAGQLAPATTSPSC